MADACHGSVAIVIPVFNDWTSLAGRPKMRFTGLVVHGLCAPPIFSDVIGVRFLVTASVAVMAGAAWAPLAGTSGLRRDPASWIASAPLTLGILMLVGLGTVLGFTFMILASRKNSEFIPLRDFRYFVLETHETTPARTP